MDNEQQNVQAPQPVEQAPQQPQPAPAQPQSANVTPIAQAQQALTAATAQQPQAPAVPKPEPVQINRLASSHNKDFVYTDKNGYDWHYTFQFPGVKKAYQMLDNARMDNGVTSTAELYDQYIQNVIVAPHGLTIESFDKRPGIEEVTDAIDTFLGEMLS